MAELVTCVICGHRNPANLWICSSCGQPKDSVPAVGAAARSVSSPVAAAAGPAIASVASTRCPYPLCDAELPTGVPACPKCGTHIARAEAAAAELTLCGPSGEQLSVVDSVALGRDPEFCLHAQIFGAYPNVGRRHALVTFTGGAATVTDLNSTNQTFLNGTTLVPFRPYPLTDGDELRLAAHCKIRIRLAGNQGS